MVLLLPLTGCRSGPGLDVDGLVAGDGPVEVGEALGRRVGDPCFYRIRN